MPGRFISATTGALCFLAAGPALAATITYGPFGAGGAFSGSTSYIIGVPRFNPSLGSLTGAELILRSQLSASGLAMNTTGPDDSFTLEINGGANLLDPITFLPLAWNSHHASSNVTAYTQPFPNSYGTSTTELTATTGTMTIPVYLSIFTGPTPIDLTVSVNGTATLTGVAPNVAISSHTLASANYISVKYTYNPVPEPATALLLISGATFILRRRRRLCQLLI